jgi:hypothetical protein
MREDRPRFRDLQDPVNRYGHGFQLGGLGEDHPTCESGRARRRRGSRIRGGEYTGRFMERLCLGSGP